MDFDDLPWSTNQREVGRLLHTFCAQVGPGPPLIFSGEGLGSLGQISILKIIIFLMIFLSFFGIFMIRHYNCKFAFMAFAVLVGHPYYVASLIIGSGMCTYSNI